MGAIQLLLEPLLAMVEALRAHQELHTCMCQLFSGLTMSACLCLWGISLCQTTMKCTFALLGLTLPWLQQHVCRAQPLFSRAQEVVRLVYRTAPQDRPKFWACVLMYLLETTILGLVLELIMRALLVISLILVTPNAVCVLLERILPSEPLLAPCVLTDISQTLDKLFAQLVTREHTRSMESVHVCRVLLELSPLNMVL